MDSKQDRSDRRQPLGWFGELYRLLAVRRDPEAAGRSAVLNAVIGLLLVAAGLLMNLGDIRAGAVERALVPRPRHIDHEKSCAEDRALI